MQHITRPCHLRWFEAICSPQMKLRRAFYCSPTFDVIIKQDIIVSMNIATGSLTYSSPNSFEESDLLLSNNFQTTRPASHISLRCTHWATISCRCDLLLIGNFNEWICAVCDASSALPLVRRTCQRFYSNWFKYWQSTAPCTFFLRHLVCMCTLPCFFIAFFVCCQTSF